ncbi:MAG: hypothetical protein UW46_C0006G0047 [Candidatus Yanofskybacteria bacterium GW2011_GWF1_44_227]|uniref:Uncharacterized protein n=1 Tax=Candidatus Yanofskybacteria bacterium GW2011_GWE2_40_11 TaxID=1619033 RepID=A0A0G0QJE9_9BACT|nr:MAG: hypothetical protein UT69_C0002G0042 [Candidatus Yanofskybacteria bacterium GW2011_GWE1_40_10]KKR40494.1 MAG: hypothetical protein UT75_C0008G0016 [Candidatus Yanofskybacteria bacterium GW2011_GWE2_40_11]KKT15438.1 MAG: hypothetical protein UV97_C0006G0005 [Candidatus Yanofskybacteria bacterium GW2011_GWF2_43_596]KKT53146.1 MAG: hypothetical protein UW46_C0006G0047 [Candidatus Yanofskybacteria bacterium GW2011_GWF1_44_227]OGN35505.1 MAG: hypothetical protein A2207_02075 [Candidatus Yano
MERLKRLMAEAEALIIGSDDEPNSGKNFDDVVIGVLPDGLKRLGVLIGRKYDQIKAMVREGIHLCDADEGLEPHEHTSEHKEFHAKVRAAEAELKFVKDLFWGLVKIEFPDANDKGELLVCIGFELVARKSEPKLDGLRQTLNAMGVDFKVVRASVGDTPQILVPGSKARN